VGSSTATCGSGSTLGIVFNPGDVRGSLLRLSDDYDLSAPGKYTVIAMQWFGYTDFASAAVARPFVLNVGKRTAMQGARGFTLAGTERSPVPAGPTDPEWSRLVAKAGVPAGRFLLEVVPPAIHHGGLYLVVSLICVDPKAGRLGSNYAEAAVGNDAADYRVLVRDAAGNPVQPLNQAMRAAVNRTPRASRIARLRFGDGVGAVIPIAELSNLKAPGIYSVLVWLPLTERNRLLLVAKPVVIEVEKP
jgi:hypothetical protein